MPTLWDDRRRSAESQRCCLEGGATASDRPELSSMADDYARHALSQRAAFEATHPDVLAAARLFADEPVLRVVDLGAADGINSHGLIRDLAEERAGRPLIYALVDLPTNAWGIAADNVRHAFSGAADGAGVVVIPASGDTGPEIADAGTGPHYASAEAHGEACRRAVEHSPPPTMVISMAGIPLQQAPCLPSGSVHVAVTGTAMHWVAEAAGMASTGSVFPGYPDHVDEAERRAWRAAAARQWERLLEMRAIELAPGGWFIAALPASPAPCPERKGLYAEIIGDMNRVLADWCRAGRIGAATVAAVVVPVWMRTLDEIRGPFEAGGGRVHGLELERAELFRLDNPYWHDDPAVFARGYVRSVLAWGGPLLLRAFGREGEDRAPGLLADFLGELEERVADAPDRYRWDYIEALVICRKADGAGRDRTR
jgi:SAM-dependent methyltransferase